MSVVRLDRSDKVATITLDRAERRNALDVPTLETLRGHLDSCASDDTVRVVVLTGAGPVFCAGADLAAVNALDDSGASLPQLIGDVLARMVDHPKPIVGRIQGSAFGGGIGLVAACDLTVAAESAHFAFSEVRLGAVPAAIAPYVLRKVAPVRAAELMLTGERVSAQVMLEAGLLTQVTSDGALDAVVHGWAEQLGRGGPQAVAVTKRVLTRVPLMDRDAATAWATSVSAAAFGSQEAAEGITAFEGGRDPSWVTGPT
jgi:methylglutaconyl-CoA hydratase